MKGAQVPQRSGSVSNRNTDNIPRRPIGYGQLFDLAVTDDQPKDALIDYGSGKSMSVMAFPDNGHKDLPGGDVTRVNGNPRK